MDDEASATRRHARRDGALFVSERDHDERDPRRQRVEHRIQPAMDNGQPGTGEQGPLRQPGGDDWVAWQRRRFDGGKEAGMGYDRPEPRCSNALRDRPQEACAEALQRAERTEGEGPAIIDKRIVREPERLRPTIPERSHPMRLRRRRAALPVE